METCRMSTAENLLTTSSADVVLNALPHPVIVVAADGKVTDANAAAEAFFEDSVAHLPEQPDSVVIMLQERTIADKMDRQLTHRSAARSVIALAAMLAHEIKNPLSGIRGAAQLLEQAASPEDRMLTRLICDEADRSVTLVDRMAVVW